MRPAVESHTTGHSSTYSPTHISPPKLHCVLAPISKHHETFLKSGEGVASQALACEDWPEETAVTADESPLVRKRRRTRRCAAAVLEEEELAKSQEAAKRPRQRSFFLVEVEDQPQAAGEPSRGLPHDRTEAFSDDAIYFPLIDEPVTVTSCYVLDYIAEILESHSSSAVSSPTMSSTSGFTEIEGCKPQRVRLHADTVSESALAQCWVVGIPHIPFVRSLLFSVMEAIIERCPEPADRHREVGEMYELCAQNYIEADFISTLLRSKYDRSLGRFVATGETKWKRATRELAGDPTDKLTLAQRIFLLERLMRKRKLRFGNASLIINKVSKATSAVHRAIAGARGSRNSSFPAVAEVAPFTLPTVLTSLIAESFAIQSEFCCDCTCFTPFVGNHFSPHTWEGEVGFTPYSPDKDIPFDYTRLPFIATPPSQRFSSFAKSAMKALASNSDPAWCVLVSNGDVSEAERKVASEWLWAEISPLEVHQTPYQQAKCRALVAPPSAGSRRPTRVEHLAQSARLDYTHRSNLECDSPSPGVLSCQLYLYVIYNTPAASQVRDMAEKAMGRIRDTARLLKGSASVTFSKEVGASIALAPKPPQMRQGAPRSIAQPIYGSASARPHYNPSRNIPTQASI